MHILWGERRPRSSSSTSMLYMYIGVGIYILRLRSRIVALLPDMISFNCIPPQNETTADSAAGSYQAAGSS